MEDGRCRPVHKDRGQIRFPALRLLGISLTEYIIAIIWIPIVSGDSAEFDTIRVPTASLLLLLEDSGVIVARTYKINCESIRRIVSSSRSGGSSELVFTEVRVESGHHPHALVPDLLRIPSRGARAGPLGPQGKMICKRLPPLEIFKVLMLSR